MNTDRMQQYTSLQNALHSLFGSDSRIKQTDRITGGDINDAYRLTLYDGMHVFMKTNTIKNAAFFTAEAAGLSAIAQTGTVRTPRVLCCGTDTAKGGFSFLLLEYIESQDRAADYWDIFAHELAGMHQADTQAFVPGGRYGFAEDNYIGAGKQINTAKDSWICFFRECRLEPQIRRAAGYFSSAELKKLGRLLHGLDRILVEPEHPSLLHGDLWSGNVMTGNDGRAWLMDPAVSVGHAEADLAMTELFGGFPQRFYVAYQEAAPLQPGYDRRRDVYNLYHLLNHLNLFGRSYLGAVMRVVEEYVCV